MGIDGWLYIGVGDYGIKEAKGKDGRTIVAARRRHRPRAARRHRAGGLLHRAAEPVRPRHRPVPEPLHPRQHQRRRRAGTRASACCGSRRSTATRNCSPTSPTRSCRRSATFGGGGGTGGLFVQDPRWPEQYPQHAVHRRLGPQRGLPARAEAERPDVRPEAGSVPARCRGRPAWTSTQRPAVRRRAGAAARRVEVRARTSASSPASRRRGSTPEPFPDLKKASPDDLIQHLLVAASPSPGCTPRAKSCAAAGMPRRRAALVTPGVRRGRAAGRPRRRGLHAEATRRQGLAARLCRSWRTTPAGPRVRPARADRPKPARLDGLDPKPFVAALADESPARAGPGAHQPRPAQRPVRGEEHSPADQRGRTGSTMPTRRPVQNQPDPDRVVPHLAVRALVALNAIDACLEALDGPHCQRRAVGDAVHARPEGRGRADQEARARPAPPSCAAAFSPR